MEQNAPPRHLPKWTQPWECDFAVHSDIESSILSCREQRLRDLWYQDYWRCVKTKSGRPAHLRANYAPSHLHQQAAFLRWSDDAALECYPGRKDLRVQDVRRGWKRRLEPCCRSCQRWFEQWIGLNGQSSLWRDTLQLHLATRSDSSHSFSYGLNAWIKFIGFSM